MFETYTLPSYLASYLINDDSSGLEESDISDIVVWIDSKLSDQQAINGDKALFYCVSMSDEIGFMSSNDLNYLGGDCAEFTFQVL